MDVILEVADTFLFDYMYAYALPARHIPGNFPDQFSSNASTLLSSWQYKPSTTLFSLEPHDVAYQSMLSRDNAARQLFSFFLIFWFVDTARDESP